MKVNALNGFLPVLLICALAGCHSTKWNNCWIVTNKVEDLRTVFLEPGKVSHLQSKNLCAVWRPRQYPKAPDEVFVGPGLLLNKVISKGYGPTDQVKVVSKNAIMQTPLYLKAESGIDPWAIPVRPGDLIFVQTVE